MTQPIPESPAPVRCERCGCLLSEKGRVYACPVCVAGAA